MNMPRELIPVDWFRFVAGINPVSYMVEGIRSLIIDGWDPVALALAFGFSVALAVAGLLGSAALLSARLTRT